MSKFKKSYSPEETLVKKTLPMPVECCSCGYELPIDAESNSGFFVNMMICRDMNRQNKTITGTPGQFLKFGKVLNHEQVLGDSSTGYHLKDNYTFVKWVVWCVKCHSNKSRLANMQSKTNNMVPSGKQPGLSIETAIAKLNKLRSKDSGGYIDNRS